MTVNQKKAASQKQWRLLLLISTAYIAVFANIQGFMGLMPLVRQTFLLSRAQVGLYSSFYFLSATLVAIFSGRIVDRLGTKRGLVIGVSAVGAMMVLHAFSPIFGIMLGLAFFTGFAFSIITPSANKGIIELAGSSKRSFFMGIVHGGGGLGGFLGASLLPFLGEMVGWRSALIIGSVFALVISLFIFKFYRPPAAPVSSAKETGHKQTSLKKDLGLLLGNRYLLCVCFMGVVFGMSTSAIGGHFPLYLTQDLGFSPAFAGLGLGAFHIGGVIGQPSLGFFNERILHSSNRKSLFGLGTIIAVFQLFIGLAISRFSIPGFALLIFSFFMGFFTMGIIAIYFTAVTELVDRKHTGVVTGLATVFIRTSVVLTPPIFGLIADFSGAYSPSWIILGAAAFLFSLLFLLFSKKYMPPSES